MEIRNQRQARPVADPVAAKIAIVRPIIASVLRSLSAEVVESFGLARDNLSRGSIPLHLLGRLRRAGDGDLGIAFEYAIHDAICKGEPEVTERINDALKLCNVRRGDPTSIFFAIEKSGSEQFINTQIELITDQSCALSGRQGRPVKLKNYLAQLAAAFRRPSTRTGLPQSINGLWKADLFLGSPTPDRWVGTSVKSNPRQLEPATGLRIGLVPAGSGKGDNVRKDSHRDLVICPIPHDESYMQAFYESWRIVQALMQTDFNLPREPALPSPVDREVARVFVERRQFGVADVIEATETFAQPHLLETNSIQVRQDPLKDGRVAETSTVVVPYPRLDL
ncbi:hypothetical protein AB0K20_02805 [Micromonospora matsumotoense]|uniref:hypothetical protein n=1 Tax=Micromonospora matsumotoense TaxID=121616 RepID=UPI003443DDE7